MTGADQPGRASVDFGASLERYALDPYQIAEATVTGDTLLVTVTHGGGCRKHEYGFVVYSGWMESNPVQVRAVILHNANGDNCKALLRNELRFDLAPLRAAYAQSYGAGGGTVIINLANPSSTNGPELKRVTYSF